MAHDENDDILLGENDYDDNDDILLGENDADLRVTGFHPFLTAAGTNTFLFLLTRNGTHGESIIHVCYEKQRFLPWHGLA